MEQEKTLKTPNNVLARMQVVHFGKIMFNLQFIALAVMVASVLSFLLPVIYYLVLICIMMLTVFTIFIFYPDFKNWLSGGETLTKISTFLAGSWKYTVPIIIVLAVLSIVCLCFDKQKRHVGRIVSSSIILVFAFIILFFQLVNSGVIA